MIFPAWIHVAAITAAFITIAQAEPQEFTAEDEQCMIDNIFYEAVSEPLLGQILVAEVVKNRTNDERWGDTICETIYQPEQFSWTLIPVYKLWAFKQENIEDYTAIATAMANSDIFMSADAPAGFEGVNHYLRCDAKSPERWEDKMEFLGQVGAHCFYRDK